MLGRTEREQDLGEADCDTRGYLTKLSQHSGSSRGISLLQRSHPAREISPPELILLNMTLFGPGPVNLGKKPHSE
ncbi:hypothetical protein AV530_007623 [Patagioenas fasciata monilis]|uniref:Uncharacterized protein n=1 Tax=Patagioenas fasciata monilis TaxID=372326 RepID=A0A1V4JYS7_PATFA|nr:hypothetical protein AV530_007623 [Patagioenas fasciata monilis]